MSESFDDFIEIRNANGNPTIRADASTATILAGGNGENGDLEFRNADSSIRTTLGGDPSRLRMYNSAGNIAVEVFASTGTVELGTSGANPHIRLVGNTGDIIAGDNGQDGDLILLSTTGQQRIRLDALNADMWIGGNGAHGNIIMFPTGGNNTSTAESTIHLDAFQTTMFMKSNGQNTLRLEGGSGNIWLGGNGADGDLVLFGSDGDNITASGAPIHIDGGGGTMTMRSGGANRTRIGNDANIWLGGNGADGDIFMFRTDGDNSTQARATIHLDGEEANLWLGGNGADGDIVLFPSDANDINDLEQASIHLNGSNGDIILSNADCAEDFDVAAAAALDAGTVVAIDENGDLRECQAAYEKCVAGVISGAGDYKPAIRLDRRDTGKNRMPVALVGKVYCKADAAFGAIRFGDLLTTSPTPGHAMKASDPARAFGAVIGKALQPLESGQDLIPILVALQ